MVEKCQKTLTKLLCYYILKVLMKQDCTYFLYFQDGLVWKCIVASHYKNVLVLLKENIDLIFEKGNLWTINQKYSRSYFWRSESITLVSFLKYIKKILIYILAPCSLLDKWALLTYDKEQYTYFLFLLICQKRIRLI